MIQTRLLELPKYNYYSERTNWFWKKEKFLVKYFEDNSDKIILDVIATSTSEKLPLDDKLLEILEKNDLCKIKLSKK